MKISKQSWHYRIVRHGVFGGFFETNPSAVKRTLCAYFWQVVWRLIEILVWIPFLVGGVIFCMTGGVICLWQHFFVLSGGNDLTSVFQIFGVIGAAIWTFLFFSLLFAFYFGVLHPRLLAFKEKRKDDGNCDHKEPGLIASYLKAKKQKICPMLEFK